MHLSVFWGYGLFDFKLGSLCDLGLKLFEDVAELVGNDLGAVGQLDHKGIDQNALENETTAGVAISDRRAGFRKERCEKFLFTHSTHPLKLKPV